MKISWVRKRIDYFIYEDSDPDRESDWEGFWGGTVKAGANFNIDERNNVYLNAGYYSRQPIFDNVFINFRNEVNPDAKNQSVVAFEGGYGFRSAKFNAKLNAYYTQWGNRQFDYTEDNDQDEEILYQFQGVEQRHIGVELEAEYKPIRSLSIYGSLGFGDWKYTSDFTAQGYNLDQNRPEGGERTLYMSGLPVGDAAQTTVSLGVGYEIIKGLRVYGDFYLYDSLFAQYQVDDIFLEPGGEIVELPAYELVDFGASYTFGLGRALRATVRFNCNNVFDKVYISDLITNIQDDPSTSWNEFYDNKGVYGFGRTWNAGLKLYF